MPHSSGRVFSLSVAPACRRAIDPAQAKQPLGVWTEQGGMSAPKGRDRAERTRGCTRKEGSAQLRGVEVFRFVGIDADVPVFGQTVFGLAVTFKELNDLMALAMCLKTLHIAPDFVEHDRETGALGKGAGDMADRKSVV